jgi:hypothetical protein
MLSITNLNTSKTLEADEMTKIKGGWFFGWGGVIGNKRRRRSYREPTRTTYYSDGRRVRDYRDNGPVWPIVE